MQQKKMSKRIVLMMTLLLNVAVMLGRPAYSKPIDILQPDGTTVTLVMHGDEFQSLTTTADGYTVVKGSDGFYRYAVKQGNVLAASAFVARNAEVREEIRASKEAKKDEFYTLILLMLSLPFNSAFEMPIKRKTCYH